jgi:hypothetical protein
MTYFQQLILWLVGQDFVSRDTDGTAAILSEGQRCVSAFNAQASNPRTHRSAYLPVGRVVMFIVDGLRYDFLAPQTCCSPSFEQKERFSSTECNKCSPSYNRFRNMQRMLHRRGASSGLSKDTYTKCAEPSNNSDFSCTVTQSRSMLLKYRADAPTVTAQRLRGMFAGSIPAFVEIGTNFNAHVVEEDSVIHQMKQAGHRYV